MRLHYPVQATSWMAKTSMNASVLGFFTMNLKIIYRKIGIMSSVNFPFVQPNRKPFLPNQQSFKPFPLPFDASRLSDFVGPESRSERKLSAAVSDDGSVQLISFRKEKIAHSIKTNLTRLAALSIRHFVSVYSVTHTNDGTC